MSSLREKLKAYTALQCPITGPGVNRLEELLTAIVEAIDEPGLYCVVNRSSATWLEGWPVRNFAVVASISGKAVAFTNALHVAEEWTRQMNEHGYIDECA